MKDNKQINNSVECGTTDCEIEKNTNVNSTIEKPYALRKREFTESIAKAINESGISLDIISYMLKETINEIDKIIYQQEMAELQQYQQTNQNK